MKTHFGDQVWRVLFIFIFVLGTVWTPHTSVGAEQQTPVNTLSGQGPAVPQTSADDKSAPASLFSSASEKCLNAASTTSVDAKTGKVKFIGTAKGRPLAHITTLPKTATPEQAARNYLRDCGSLLGLEDQAAQLSFKHKTVDQSKRTVVRFQQVHQDIPIFAGELVMQLDSAKNVLLVNGHVTPHIKVDTEPSTLAADAQATALQRVMEEQDVDTATLVASEPDLWIYDPALIMGKASSASLVWRIQVSSSELAPIRYLILVDAHKGSVVLSINEADTALNRQTYTANNTSTRPGELVCDESNPNCSGGDDDAVNAHLYTGDTYNFYSTYHDRDSIDDAGMTLNSTVHYSTAYCNAFWDGNQMTYGDGCPIVRDDIVAHEITHGVTQYTSGLVYAFESGAINESFSDIWGEWIDLTNGRGLDTPEVRWYIGEEIWGGGNSAFRNMKDPTEYGNADRMTSPFYYIGSNDNGGVHWNSGVGNKAAYLITDGGNFNGYEVTGLGIPKASKIYYEAQTNILTSGSDYGELYTALYMACTNLIGTVGITAADCQEVRDATDATEMNQEPVMPPAPVNDDFDSPLLINTLNYSNTQTDLFAATTAADDPALPCTTYQAQNSVWYQYVASETGMVVFDTVSSNYDTVLSIWTGSRGSLTNVACNDDIDLYNENYQSRVVVNAVAGQTYFIEVASWGFADSLTLNAALYSLPTECTSGLCVQVVDSSGTPVSYAEIEVYTSLDTDPVADATTNNSGYAQIDLNDGDYIVAVASTSQHFMVMKDVSVPQLVTIDPSNTVQVTISAKKLDDTPLSGDMIQVHPSRYSTLYVGYTNSNGELTTWVTPGSYHFLLWSWDSLYYLGLPDVAIPASSTVNLHAASLPTGQLTVGLTDFSDAYLVPSTSISDNIVPLLYVATGETVVFSAMDYEMGLDLRKVAGSNSWNYRIYKDYSITNGNSLMYDAGGDFTASTQVTGAAISPGDVVSIDNLIQDSYANRVTRIYVETAGQLAAQDTLKERSMIRGQENPYQINEDGERIEQAWISQDPSITVKDPSQTVISQAQNWNTWYSHNFTLPDLGMPGTYTVTLSVDTGPHMGIITATDAFNVVARDYLKASDAEDWVHAYGWANGTNLTLQVDDPSNGVGIDYTSTTTAEQAPWNPTAPDVVGIFNLSGVYNLHPGDKITITGAGRSVENYIVPDQMTQIRWFIGLGTGSDPNQVPAEHDVVVDFNMSHAETELLLEIVPNNQARETLTAEMDAGNGPDIIGPVGWGGSNSFYGRWLDLAPYIASTQFDTSIFDPRLVDMYQTEEGEVGLPFALYPAMIYYNPALFDSAGLNYPPANYSDLYEMPDHTQVEWSWETVAQVAKLLTRDANGNNATQPNFDRNNIVQYGFSFGWQNHPNYWGSYWQSGSLFGGTPGNYVVNVPNAWQESWEWVYDGIWSKQPYIPAGAAYDSLNGGNVFSTGQVGMVELPSWYQCCLGEYVNAGNRFQYAAMPSYNGQVAGRIDADTFRIWEGTAHPDAAFEALAYLVTTGVDKLIVGSPDTPAPYGGISAITTKQQASLNTQAAQFPFVTQESWDVMMDGLSYRDAPSAEYWMPSYDDAWNHLQNFANRLVHVSGLDLADEIGSLESELRYLFNNGQLYSPTFAARFPENEIHGYGWPLGANVTVTIDDPDNGVGIDYTDTQTVVVADWDPNQTFVQFRLWQDGFQLQPDQAVHVSDGSFSKNHVVTHLTVNTVDPNTDTISGTAEPGSLVEIGHLYCDETGCHAFRRVFADENGDWTVDFAHPGEDEDEQELFDITPGYGNEARQVDWEGDSTNAQWRVRNPFVEAGVTYDWVSARDWPLGTEVTLTIDGAHGPYTTTAIIQQAPWNPGDPNDTVAFFDLQGYDILPGDSLTAMVGSESKNLIVSGLEVTSYELETDTLAGRATPGVQVEVCANIPDDCVHRWVMSDDAGNWTANYTGDFDLQLGSSGWVLELDVDGDQTWYDWNIPNPHIDAWFVDEHINAYDWPLNTLLTLDVEDPDTALSPDYSVTTQVGVAPWDSNSTLGEFYLDGIFNIEPGMTLTVSGAGFSKELVIANLTLTGIDVEADTIMGTSDPNQAIWMNYDNPTGDCCRNFQADSGGNWVVDYSQLGSEGEPVEDIGPGSSGNINAVDDDGDNTSLSWRVPNPTFSVRFPENEIHGYEWPLGSTVTLTVDNDTDPTNGFLYGPVSETVLVADWDPNQTFVPFRVWQDEFVLQANQIVTLTDGVTTKTHTVTHLTITEADHVADTVSGTAITGTVVEVGSIYCDETGCHGLRRVTADENGNWVANFAVAGEDSDEQDIIDVKPGMGSEARQSDNDWDSTTVQWGVPSYTIHTVPSYPEVHGHDWPAGADVTLTVDDDNDSSNGVLYTQTKNVDDDPWCGNPCFDLLGEFDLLVGQYATMTDGVTTQTVLVSQLTVTDVNIDNETISGIADPNSDVMVNIWSQSGQARHVVADANGDWTVDYSQPGDEDFEQDTANIDLGDNGRAIQLNPDGSDNGTLEYWNVPNPVVSVRFPENKVDGYDWELGAEVTLYIDIPNNGKWPDYEATQIVRVSTWDPNQTYVAFDLGNFELQAGQFVTLTDEPAGQTTKVHQVRDVTVTAVDTENDTVSGTAEPGAVVEVGHMYCDDTGCYAFRRVTADADGNWLADFAHEGEDPDEQDIFNIVPGTASEAREPDGDWDNTTVQWYAGWMAPTSVPMVVALKNDVSLSNFATDLDTWTVLNLTMETLYRNDTNGDLVPAAATNYTISADGRVYTITLRSDAVWSDGVPVTAQNYVDGILYLLDPDNGFDYAPLLYPIVGAQGYYDGTISDPNLVGVTALTANTLQITLSTPSAHFAQLFAFPTLLPVRNDLIALYGDAWADGANFVGNGPYKIDEHDGAHLLLSQNPYYYSRGRLAYSQIGFSIIPSSQYQVTEYESGHVDVVLNLSYDPGLSDAVAVPQPGTTFLGFNFAMAPTNDPVVRQALVSAIDKASLVSAMGKSWLVGATGMIPPELPGSQHGAVGYEFDATQAQTYLASAGYPGGIGFPEIKLAATSNQAPYIEAIAAQWRSVLGIDVSIAYYSSSELQALRQDCADNPLTCGVNAIPLGWYTDYPDPYNMLHDLLAYAAVVAPGWNHASYDAQITASETATEPSQRLLALQAAEDIMVEDDIAVLPLYHGKTFGLIRPGIVPVLMPIASPYLDLWGPCFTLGLNVNPANGGNVAVDPSPNCSGGTQYSHGTVVQLTATPATGYTFLSWSGNVSGTANSIAVTMDGNKLATASFGLLPGTFSKSSPANGTTGTTTNRTLTWNASTGATSYEYCLDESDNGQCDTSWLSTGTSRTVTPSGVQYGKTYYWQVRARNANGTSDANTGTWWSYATRSGPFNKITPTASSAGVPLNTALTWGASVGASEYQYCLDETDNGLCDTVWLSTGANRTVTPAGLQYAHTYYWQVRALYAGYANEANTSTWWSFTTQPGNLNKSFPTSGTTGTATNRTLSWSASMSATEYQYCIDDSDNGVCNTSWVSTGSLRSATPTGLLYAKTYYWQVRAVYLGGYAYANGGSWWNFSTRPSPFVKSLPTSGTVGLATNRVLSWGTSLRAQEYQYCVDATNDNACDGENWISTGTTRTATPVGLSYGTTYYWQVRALYQGAYQYANSGAWWSFSTKPGVFNKTGPVDGATNVVLTPTLTWGASNGATEYQYCLNTTPVCTVWLSAGTSQNVTLTEPLLPGTLYYWQVRSVFNGGYNYANNNVWRSFITAP